MTKSISDQLPLREQPSLKCPRLDTTLDFPPDIIRHIFGQLGVYALFCNYKYYALVSKNWYIVTYRQMSECDILKNVEKESIPSGLSIKVFKEAFSQRIRVKGNFETKSLKTKDYSKILLFKEYLIVSKGNNLIIHNLLSQEEPKKIECKANICTLYASEGTIFCGLITNEIIIYSLPELKILTAFNAKSTIVKILVSQELLLGFSQNGSIEVYNRNANCSYEGSNLVLHLHAGFWNKLVFFKKTLYWYDKMRFCNDDNDYLFYHSYNPAHGGGQISLGKCSSNICIQDNFCYFVKKNDFSESLSESSSFCIYKLGGFCEKIVRESFLIEGITTYSQLLVIGGVFAVVARTYHLPNKPMCRSLEIYDLDTQKCVHAIDIKGDFIQGGLSFSEGKIFCLSNNGISFNTICHTISFPLPNTIDCIEHLEEPGPEGLRDSSPGEDFDTYVHGSPHSVLKDRDCGLSPVQKNIK